MEKPDQKLHSCKTPNDCELRNAVLYERENLCQPILSHELALDCSRPSKTLCEFAKSGCGVGISTNKIFDVDRRCNKTGMLSELVADPKVNIYCASEAISSPTVGLTVPNIGAVGTLIPVSTMLNNDGHCSKGSELSNGGKALDACHTLSDKFENAEITKIRFKRKESGKSLSHVVPSASMAIRDYAIPLKPKRNLFIKTSPDKIVLKRKLLTKMNDAGKSLLADEKKRVCLSKDVYDFDEEDDSDSQIVSSCKWSYSQSKNLQMMKNLAFSFQNVKSVIQEKNTEELKTENQTNFEIGNLDSLCLKPELILDCGKKTDRTDAKNIGLDGELMFSKSYDCKGMSDNCLQLLSSQNSVTHFPLHSGQCLSHLSSSSSSVAMKRHVPQENCIDLQTYFSSSGAEDISQSGFLSSINKDNSDNCHSQCHSFYPCHIRTLSTEAERKLMDKNDFSHPSYYPDAVEFIHDSFSCDSKVENSHYFQSRTGMWQNGDLVRAVLPQSSTANSQNLVHHEYSSDRTACICKPGSPHFGKEGEKKKPKDLFNSANERAATTDSINACLLMQTMRSSSLETENLCKYESLGYMSPNQTASEKVMGNEMSKDVFCSDVIEPIGLCAWQQASGQVTKSACAEMKCIQNSLLADAGIVSNKDAVTPHFSPFINVRSNSKILTRQFEDDTLAAGPGPVNRMSFVTNVSPSGNSGIDFYSNSSANVSALNDNSTNLSGTNINNPDEFRNRVFSDEKWKSFLSSDSVKNINKKPEDMKKEYMDRLRHNLMEEIPDCNCLAGDYIEY